MDNFINGLKDSTSLNYAFCLSVFLLVLISLLKYFISKESERRDWGNFILEFPIDVCLVLITIIITGYMKGENIPVGVILLIVSLVISVICCLLRRSSINYSYVEGNWFKTWGCAILDVAIAVVWTWFVYSKIC